MIVTRAPLRLPIGGGGSDLPAYYTQHGGSFLSAAIDKFVYVIINPRFSNSIRVSYSRTEIASHVEDIQHPIVREALRLVGITGGIEIVSVADLPAGTGMGSSGSFTVALLLALHRYLGQDPSPRQLADEAFALEAIRLGDPVGKQDGHVAAYGGLRRYDIKVDGTVTVRAINGKVLPALATHLLMFYTGLERSAAEVLSTQAIALKTPGEAIMGMHAIVGIGHEIEQALSAGNIVGIGELMHRHWLAKQRANPSASSTAIDHWYQLGLAHGADGGKIMGAGGGGFLLLVAEPARHAAIRTAMERAGLMEVPFSFEPHGAQVILHR